MWTILRFVLLGALVLGVHLVVDRPEHTTYTQRTETVVPRPVPRPGIDPQVALDEDRPPATIIGDAFSTTTPATHHGWIAGAIAAMILELGYRLSRVARPKSPKAGSAPGGVA